MRQNCSLLARHRMESGSPSSASSAASSAWLLGSAAAWEAWLFLALFFGRPAGSPSSAPALPCPSLSAPFLPALPPTLFPRHPHAASRLPQRRASHHAAPPQPSPASLQSSLVYGGAFPTGYALSSTRCILHVQCEESVTSAQRKGTERGRVASGGARGSGPSERGHLHGSVRGPPTCRLAPWKRRTPGGYSRGSTDPTQRRGPRGRKQCTGDERQPSQPVAIANRRIKGRSFPQTPEWCSSPPAPPPHPLPQQ